jgi:hypothetical protein
MSPGGRPATPVTSCHSCFAWGKPHAHDICRLCYVFALRNKIAGECASCGRLEQLSKGHCRLCWTQAALERPERTSGRADPIGPYVRQVRYQQLFLAVRARRRAAPKRLPRGTGPTGNRVKPPPPVAGRPVVIWVQLPLFVVPRHYRYGLVDLRCGPPPENAWLAWALHLAHTMAESRGFNERARERLNRNLVMLLAEHRDGELVRSSDFYQVLIKTNLASGHTSAILEEMGVLLDDRPAAFEGWLAAKLDGLAPGIRADTQRWARLLHDGAPRSSARSPASVKIYVTNVTPGLMQWSERHSHLREITHVDILAHLKPLHGWHRRITLIAFRSLFAWAKSNGVIFRDPASQIRVGAGVDPVWQPLAPADIARSVDAATTPQARLLVALAAVHAARIGAIRAIQLDDVDLPNRRLTIAGHTRPLDDLTHQVLLQWLDYRRRRWPNTANRHLLVTTHSALRLGPVSAPWAAKTLPAMTGNLQRLQMDRQLEEALTHRADPLHLRAVFGIPGTTAIRYAASARKLLEEPEQAHPLGSLPTQVSVTGNQSAEHSGSC